MEQKATKVTKKCNRGAKKGRAAPSSTTVFLARGLVPQLDPMAWPNRLSLSESSIFFVSFATFCSNSERYRAREIRRGQQTLRPNSKESPPR